MANNNPQAPLLWMLAVTYWRSFMILTVDLPWWFLRLASNTFQPKSWNTFKLACQATYLLHTKIGDSRTLARGANRVLCSAQKQLGILSATAYFGHHSHYSQLTCISTGHSAIRNLRTLWVAVFSASPQSHDLLITKSNEINDFDQKCIFSVSKITFVTQKLPTHIKTQYDWFKIF